MARLIPRRMIDMARTVERAGNIDDPEDIASTLLVEKVDQDLYRSLSKLSKPHPKARAVFGGQILGQALLASHRTLDRKDLVCHSMHAYFILPGSPDHKAVYLVDRVRDGKSFSTRSVTVKQNGKAIFTAHMSFHRPEESLLEHQAPMPAVPPPEACVSMGEHIAQIAERLRGEGRSARADELLADFEQNLQPFPLEMRHVDPEDSLLLAPVPRSKEPKLPRMQFWFRSKKSLPDVQWAHDCVATFASDRGMPVAAAKPLPHPSRYSIVASLDHCIWFHAPYRADEWLLYDVESTRAGSGRALCHGKIYTLDGKLVASSSQEALMRLAEPASRAPPSTSANTARL